jgi:hypothetical protein
MLPLAFPAAGQVEMLPSRLALLLLFVAFPAQGEEPSFTKQIAPLLRQRCLKCHSGRRPRGDLTLTTRAGLLEGGATGPAVKPGKAGDSLLFQHVQDKKMPPREPLAEREVTLLRAWIDAGRSGKVPP